MTENFSKPQEVDDVTLAFPANIMHLMPDRKTCDEELSKLDREEEKKWRDFQKTWFFFGLSEDTKVDLKEGINGHDAFRHLGAIQGSFEPKHEHKESGVAYLCSLWFNDVSSYKPEKKE